MSLFCELLNISRSRANTDRDSRFDLSSDIFSNWRIKRKKSISRGESLVPRDTTLMQQSFSFSFYPYRTRIILALLMISGRL
jgi:hypothetical protein